MAAVADVFKEVVMFYIKVGDKFVFRSELAGAKIPFRVININEFRPPDMKYGIELAIPNSDAFFVGDEWFEKHNDQIERMEG